MIELRWTWTEQANGILAAQSLSTPGLTLYPMLQYRYRAPRITDGINSYPPEWPWSEWIDVPLPEKP